MDILSIFRKSKSKAEQLGKNVADSQAFKSTKETTKDAAKLAKEAIQSVDKEDVQRAAETVKIAWFKFDKDARMALIVGVVAYFIAQYLPLGSKIPPMVTLGVGGWYFISAKISSAGKN